MNVQHAMMACWTLGLPNSRFLSNATMDHTGSHMPVAHLLIPGLAVAQMAMAVDSGPGNQELYTQLASHQAACGANSVFVFLRLWGIQSAYAEIEGMVPRNAQGASLASLAHACRQAGLPVATVAVNWREIDIREVELPVIGHLVQPEHRYGGHFVVLVSFKGDWARYIDGTSGAIIDRNWEYLSERLTGFCIVSESSLTQTPGHQWTTAILTTLAMLVSVYAMKRRVKVAMVGLMIYWMVFIGTSELCAGTSKSVCGKHALVLLLTAYEKPTGVLESTEESMVEEGCTLHHFQIMAQRAGLPVTLVQAKPQDLSLLPTPFLATLEGTQGEPHVFCVVHYVGKEYVDVIDDATVSHRRIKWSTFIRDWSGYVAYVPSQSVSLRKWASFVIGLPTGFLIAHFALSQLKKPNKGIRS